MTGADSRPAASRDAGLLRLADFVPRAGRDYARSRNVDFGPERRGNVSMLSPYLRHRLVLEEEVLAAVLERHGAEAAGKFVQEILWRGYFKGWLEHHPAVWRSYRAALDSSLDAMADDASLRRGYDAALAANTGIDCFDAWVEELVATGYLHNHARMWFASIWIFTLALPWQLGADFFLRHLIDGDPASNTLGWRWVGGLHTRGKTYLARASNIARYTDGRFDPAGKLAASATALTENPPAVGGPLPVVPEAGLGDLAFGLLVTEDDAQAESLALHAAPSAVIGLAAPAGRSPRPVAQRVRDFAAGAVADGVARAAAHFGIAGESRACNDWGPALADFAGRENLEAIALAYAPTGPVRDRIAPVRPYLARRGVRLVEILRPYDAAVWPHSAKGFFGLKSKIPAIFKRLSLAGKPHEDQGRDARCHSDGISMRTK